MRQDIVDQLADYRGVLGWDSFTDAYTSTFHSYIEIPLYIKDHPIPIRKQKTSEITTVPQMDHRSEVDTTTLLVFFGAPELLQISISGFIITPWSSTTNQWQTPFGNYTYGEIVDGYLSGKWNRSVGGAYQRMDPAYYISPYGQRYDYPVIASWESAFTQNAKKQTFSAQIYLEK